MWLMPHNWLFHFYCAAATRLLSYPSGVNALWRAFFISTTLMEINGTPGLKSVNALWRAFFISTKIMLAVMAALRTCQCPMTGFFHFYWPGRRTGIHEWTGCQCPMTGFFHFYFNFFRSWRRRCSCVNALWRAFFISTKINRDHPKCSRRVSMPYDGLFSFLRFAGIHGARVFACQCPMTGFFHFYRQRIFQVIRDYVGVNALWQAFFISTRDDPWSQGQWNRVSMPYDGLFSFLPNGNKWSY